MIPGLVYGGIYGLLNGREPFDLRNKPKDSEQTKKKEDFKVEILYKEANWVPKEGQEADIWFVG